MPLKNDRKYQLDFFLNIPKRMFYEPHISFQSFLHLFYQIQIKILDKK